MVIIVQKEIVKVFNPTVFKNKNEDANFSQAIIKLKGNISYRYGL